MMSLEKFTKFPELPPEIQLQIWESTIATQPAMHVFNVCVPPYVTESAASTILSPTSENHNEAEDEGTDRPSSKREEIYLDDATDTLYLTPIAATEDPSSQSTGTTPTHGAALFRYDPSMYKFRGSLAGTCIDAAATLRRSLVPSSRDDNNNSDTNTIFIGAPSTERACASVTYDNTQDVLHLRFSPPAFRFPEAGGGGGEGRRLRSPLSAIFKSIWSQELSGALHRARRVAVDVSQLWPTGRWAARGEQQQGGGGPDGEGEGEAQHEVDGEAEVGVLDQDGREEEAGGHDDEDASLVMQDIAFLACTMQNDLEVLYVVDYCAGHCGSHPSSSLKARDLMERSDKGLYRSLGNGETWQKEKTRKPDVIQGVGKVWREVFDLEKLGWDEEHPGFVFAEMFTEVVKMQQGNWMDDDRQEGDPKARAKFQGVRVLVVEDEQINGGESSMILQCDGHEHGGK